MTCHARLIALAVITVAATAAAQPAAAIPGEATVLVPPQGGTADVPVRFSSNVLLTFPSQLAPRVVQSSTDWEVRDFAEGVVARAVTATAQPTTLALTTRDGALQVNITLRLVPETTAALTLVRFQSATAAEAFDAAVDAEVARRTAALETTIRTRTDQRIARAVRARLEVRRLKAHARNPDHVIVHAQRLVLLGDDAYLLFELENRSSAAYHPATVQLLDPTGTDHAGPTTLTTVTAGTSAFATLVIHRADRLRGQPLRLVLAEAGGHHRIVVDRGLSIR